MPAPAAKSHVRGTLIAEAASIQPGAPFWVGLRLDMDPGWHTYWVNPGEAGLATRVRWTLPTGFTADPLVWPEPKKIVSGGVVSYGYEGTVFLMAQIKAAPDLSVLEPAALRAHVDWMECADVCVPGSADLSLELPVKAETPALDPKSQEEFSRARAALPLPESQSPWRVSFIETPSEWRLMFRPPPGAPCLDKRISFFPDQSGLVSPSGTQKWEWLGDGCRLDLKKINLTDRPRAFSGLVIRSDGWDATGSRHALQVRMPVK